MNTKHFLNLVAGNVFQSQTTPAIPTEYYICLSNTTPNINGSNVNEPPASGSYQRIKLTNLSAPTDGVITNNADISWPESTSDWGIVTSYVIFDSSTVGAGNLLVFGDLSTPRSVERDTIMTIKAAYLRLSALNPSST